jgi:hypothetical protein
MSLSTSDATANSRAGVRNGPPVFAPLSLFPPPVLAAPPPAADPCAGRHGGNECSTAAHRRILPHKGETYARILAIIRARGAAGATVKELAQDLGTHPSNISGRLTELKQAGELVHKIDQAGRKVRRDGAAVLVLGMEG